MQTLIQTESEETKRFKNMTPFESKCFNTNLENVC